MTVQTREAGTGSALLVLPLLALIIDAAIFAAGKAGFSPLISIPIIGGLDYRVNPLIPVVEALILGWGLWRYAGLGVGATVLTIIFVVIFRIAGAAIGNYLTGILIAHLSDAIVTDPRAFMLPVLLQTIFTTICFLIVPTVSSRAFRSVAVWIWVIVLWSVGTTAVYALFRDGTISGTTSLYLTPVVRALGFIAIGWAVQRRVA